jgi:uncharacterized protein
VGKLIKWWRWGRWVALAYLSGCLCLCLFQERAIYQPKAEITTTPADRNLVSQDVWLPTDPTGENPEKIFGWWLPAAGKATATILYLHGYNDNIGDNLEPATHLTQRGFNVFLIDYRGYGKSKANFPSEKQIYRDVEVAWDYLKYDRKIPAKKIVIFGHSLGGAVAIDLVTLHDDVGSVIVQSSFTSMADIIATSPWSKLVPIPLLLSQRFDSIAKVRSLKMPVLYLHGAADSFVPHAMSRALYTATGSEKKQFILVANAKHENSSKEFNTSEQIDEISEFIHQSIASK